MCKLQFLPLFVFSFVRPHMGSPLKLTFPNFHLLAMKMFVLCFTFSSLNTTLYALEILNGFLPIKVNLRESALSKLQNGVDELSGYQKVQKFNHVNIIITVYKANLANSFAGLVCCGPMKNGIFLFFGYLQALHKVNLDNERLPFAELTHPKIVEPLVI